MPVPDYQTLMRPVLALTEDGHDWSASSIREAIISQFQLSAEDVEERLPSGRDTALRNRVGWALQYLYRAGLLDRPGRSVYRITDRGRDILRRHPERVDKSVLDRFAEFREFVSGDAAPRRRRPEASAQPALPLWSVLGTGRSPGLPGLSVDRGDRI